MFISNISNNSSNYNNCECQCDKTCDIGEYLDYKNCNRKKIVDKLIDECTETIGEVKLANITLIEFHSLENENNCKYSSCRVYLLFVIVIFTILLELLFILFTTIGLWLKIMFLALNFVLTKKTTISRARTYKWEK